MPAPREIESITVVIAPGDVGKVSMDKYIDQLLTAYYELPGILLETEIDVMPGAESSYAGIIRGASTPMGEELEAVAKTVLKKMQAA